MSFKFKNRTVTLENYSTIYAACSPDVLDEIRSAVLDNTPIGGLINPCGNDSYLLGQLRIAIREGVPQEFINPRLTGRTVYNIRQGLAIHRNMDMLTQYFNGKSLKLDKAVIEKLSEFCLLGVDISRVDFVHVPTALVEIFCKGLYRGYPMWLLVDEYAGLTEELVRILMRGMELGVDVHPFIRGSWDKDVLLMLFSYSKTADLNDVLRYLNPQFDSSQVKVLLDLSSHGIPISRLCVKDSSGAPVYNSYQMFELGRVLKAGVDIRKMFDPKLSDFDMAMMLKEEEARRACVEADSRNLIS